jgi:DHA1 family tetracycline resistance protein-like MFS transporter
MLVATILVPTLGTLTLVCVYFAFPQQPAGVGGGRTMGIPTRTVHTMAVLCLWGVLTRVGGGMTSTPQTELLLQRACERQGISFGTHACDTSSAAQHEATYRSTYLNVAGQSAGFASIGVASVIADSFGRKPSLFLITLGAVLGPLSVWLIPMDTISFFGYHFDGYWIILVWGALTVLFGGGASLSVSMSVMSDVSSTLSAAGRTNCLMLLEAATWGGNMIGPVLGAKLVTSVGLRGVFGLSSAFSAAGLAVIVLGYTETLDPVQRVQFSWARANPVGQLYPLVAHRTMIKFALILGPTYLMSQAIYDILAQLYLIRVVDASLMELAELLSLAQAVGIFGLLVVLPVLQGWGVGRRVFIRSAMAICVVQWFGMACLGFTAVQRLPTAVFDAAPYAIQVLGLMLGPFMPCCRASVATLAESGQMDASVAVSLGALSALSTIVYFFAPLIFSPLYAATEGTAPELVFLVATALAAAAAAVAWTLPNLEAIGRPPAAVAEPLLRDVATDTVGPGEAGEIQ